MVEKTNKTLMESFPLESVEYVVIHNDAGSKSPVEYIDWLENRDKSLGIAHYYINKDEIVRVVDTYNTAFHTGDFSSNIHSLGYEICQSYSADDISFLKNEDMALIQAVEDMIFYGLDINSETVKVHGEFTNTSCPHRSLHLHGGNIESLKNYFIEKMQYFKTLGNTVEEILENLEDENSLSLESVDDDTLDEIAYEVIRGNYGNGEERKKLLEENGFNYEKVQSRVNDILSS